MLVARTRTSTHGADERGAAATDRVKLTRGSSDAVPAAAGTKFPTVRTHWGGDKEAVLLGDKEVSGLK